MSVTLKDPEKAHSRLFHAHKHLVASGEAIHEVIVALIDGSRHRESREQLKATLVHLQDVRDQIDGALSGAGTARTELIRLTGCDGSCSNGK